MGKGNLLTAPFISYIRFEKRFSPHTILSYTNDLNQFFDYLRLTYGEDPEIHDISHHFVRSWLAELKSQGISSKSIARKISALKSFYRYLLRQKLVPFSPMIKIVAPKLPRRLPGFVRQSEMDLLDSRMGHAVPAGSGPLDFEAETEQLIIRILYATGIRLSELISLKTNHIDRGNRTIKVLGKGSRERIIPVSDTLLDQIRAYEEKKAALGDQPDFQVLLVLPSGKKLYPKYVYRVVSRMLGKVTTQDRLSPHLLRHTFATHLAGNGADLNAIKELLGHSSLAATQVYTHNTIGRLKEIHQKSHPKS
ncbi:MAG TPA: tyrosine-type recombinase/integrase [Chitinophagaceae bacterium]|nr:tyrosine-type recombinase/integrase [Chitinophagaceae bacterium]